MDEEKPEKLNALCRRLREVASKRGTLHSFWDVISDIERFQRGETTIVNQTIDEWIQYAEELLGDTSVSEERDQ